MRFTNGRPTRQGTNDDDAEGNDMTTAEKATDDAATIEALAIQFARLQMEHQSRKIGRAHV